MFKNINSHCKIVIVCNPYPKHKVSSFNLAPNLESKFQKNLTIQSKKNHLSNIDETKNVCLHFTSQAKVTDGCKM